jgi:hypothetical protein
MQGAWLLLVLNGLSPASTAPADCAARLCWQVSPQICVTEQPGQLCQAALQLNWQSQTLISPCLYLAEQKLHCWQNSYGGQWQQQLSWQNANLSLRSADDSVLLQTSLQVQSRKPARRRLNSPWSLF